MNDAKDDSYGMNHGINIGFRDLIIIILMIFVIFAVLMMPHINDPKKEEEYKKAANLPGNVSVEMRWGDGIDADVDLWVQAPDGRGGFDAAVGYSNLGGDTFNLLRDDRGYQMTRGSTSAGTTKGAIPKNINTNLMHLNFENAYSRGMPEGEWIVNVHLWNQRTAKLPIEVTIAVIVKKPNSNPKQILTSTVLMRGTGHEMTIVRFRLDSEGNLIKTSLNADFKKLAPSRVEPTRFRPTGRGPRN